ncbi:hypothetical protein V1478_013045 [Vespula squamosa]|uniref:Uncharacterized protein n=1 Tax=Vespula squamosa TaxID=30214 RepID=A0ABD2A9V6_VESSQ
MTQVQLKVGFSRVFEMSPLPIVEWIDRIDEHRTNEHFAFSETDSFEAIICISYENAIIPLEIRNEIDGNAVWKHARFCDNPSTGFWQIFKITEVHILEGSEVSNGRVAGKQSIPLSVDSSEGRASFCYVALVEVGVVVWLYRRDYYYYRYYYRYWLLVVVVRVERSSVVRYDTRQTAPSTNRIISTNRYTKRKVDFIWIFGNVRYH